LLAGGLVVVMGFVDDRWGMGVISKLAGQVAAGVILVWSGAEVTWLPAPHGTTLGLTSDQQIAVTILVVVITINAVNFMDGLDGLAAGIVGIGAAAFFGYYFTLTHRLGLPDQAGPALASAVLAGICLGFLPHNYHPARIFMGDTGAMLIGLLLAYAPISSLASLDPGSLINYASGTAINRFGTILPLLLPAAIMLIPYADLLMAVIRRARKGMSPFAPDRQHLHHRMLDIGHSHRTSVLIMYLWAALFAGSVVWLSIAQTPLIVLVIVTVGAMLVLLFVSMPRLRPWARGAAHPATGPGAAGTGGAPSATASPTGAHARRPAARTPARTGPTPRASAPPDRTPAPSAQAPRPSVPAAASPSGPTGSAAWLPAPPPPEAALHPTARDAVPGTAGPEGAQPASWPGGPQETTPSPWPSSPQVPPPWPPAPQDHSSQSLSSPQESPPWPSSPTASAPSWPSPPPASASPWPATSSPSPPSRPGGPPESSPPWQPAPPAPPAPSTRPKL